MIEGREEQPLEDETAHHPYVRHRDAIQTRWTCGGERSQDDCRQNKITNRRSAAPSDGQSIRFRMRPKWRDRLYHKNIDDGRRTRHGDATPPGPMTVMEA